MAASKSHKVRYSDEHLSQFDVFWLRNDVPENRMVINFCLSLEKQVDLSQVNEYMKRWSIMYPRFRSRTVKRSLCTYDWEPVPNFDPLTMGCLTQHKLKSGTHEELEAYTNQCFNEVLPKDSFQWRIYKVDNTPWGGSLIIWRLHHCVCDGLAVVNVIRSVFEAEEPPTASQEPEEPRRRRPRGTPLQKAFKMGKLVAPILVGMAAGYGLSLGLANSVLLGVSLLVVAFYGKAIWQTFGMITGVRRPDSNTSLKVALGGTKRSTVMRDSISLASVRELVAACSTKTSHCTLNDVLCAMVGGAFRRYFREERLNPNKLTLRCVMPVNVRGPKEEFLCENRFTLVFANLPVHLELVKERVKYMHQVMRDLKNGFEPLTGVTFIYGLGLLPQSIMERVVRFYCVRASMVVTNVDMGRKRLCFSGVPMTSDYTIAWVPSAGGIGIGVSFLSFMGRLNVGLIADTKQVPKLGMLADCFHQEWTNMRDELLPNK